MRLPWNRFIPYISVRLQADPGPTSCRTPCNARNGRRTDELRPGFAPDVAAGRLPAGCAPAFSVRHVRLQPDQRQAAISSVSSPCLCVSVARDPCEAWRVSVIVEANPVSQPRWPSWPRRSACSGRGGRSASDPGCETPLSLKDPIWCPGASVVRDQCVAVGPTFRSAHAWPVDLRVSVARDQCDACPSIKRRDCLPPTAY